MEFPSMRLAATLGEAPSVGVEVRDGVGDGDVDASALAEMAGDPSRYFQAPDSTALAQVYDQVARSIVCPLPGGGFFGQRR
jgi:hypothetical protein